MSFTCSFRGFSPGLAGKRGDTEGSLLRLIALLYITLHQFEVLYLLEKMISPFAQWVSADSARTVAGNIIISENISMSKGVLLLSSFFAASPITEGVCESHTRAQ